MSSPEGGETGVASSQSCAQWCWGLPRAAAGVWHQQTTLARRLLQVPRDAHADVHAPMQWMTSYVTRTPCARQHKCLRHVVGVVWAVTFGGNMQTPVVSFFYQDIGMTPVEIGTAGFIIMACLLLSSPAYGYVLDTWGAYEALLLSLSVCGVGCFARALCWSAPGVYAAAVLLGLGSSFETMALATLARSWSEPGSRALLVSGFLLQIKCEPACECACGWVRSLCARGVQVRVRVRVRVRAWGACPHFS